VWVNVGVVVSRAAWECTLNIRNHRRQGILRQRRGKLIGCQCDVWADSPDLLLVKSAPTPLGGEVAYCSGGLTLAMRRRVAVIAERRRAR
jgi:hypothetical protein